MRAVRESEERLTSLVESIDQEHSGPISVEEWPTCRQQRVHLDDPPKGQVGLWEVSALLWLGTSSPDIGLGKLANA